MQKFLFRSALLLLPIFVFVVAVNYHGDAGGLYHRDYTAKMVQISASGNSITNIENYNERLFLKEIISHRDVRPDVVVLGSSRSMLLDRKLFNDQDLINCSLSGASMQDLIAIYQILKKQDKLPRKILIGIDPWLFNAKRKDTRWRSLASDYGSFHGKGPESTISPRNIAELFSLSYFQNSIRNIPKLWNGTDLPVATKEEKNRTDTKRTDGSLVYGKQFRDATPKKIKEKVIKYIDGGLYGMNDFQTISEDLWLQLEQLIDDLQQQGIEVEFLLVPYHPTVDAIITKKYPVVYQVERKVIEFAKSRKISLCGSFDPSNTTLDKTHFYDGMHLKEDGVDSLMQDRSLIAKDRSNLPFL